MCTNSIVEFADRASAERAIKELGERSLLGRPVFIREVRRSRLRLFKTLVSISL
jgi:RNA recognition motif-containing protein